MWLFLRSTGGVNTELDRYDPTEDITGWYHVDVTRNSLGQFYLYINGTHRMDAVDSTENTANYFAFYCGNRDALDNVVVSDTVDFADPTTTDTITPPPPIPGFPRSSIIVGGTLALTLGLVARKRRHTA